MVIREELYFEPRCIDDRLSIRWYGERYSAKEFERHYQETVYIRDNGKFLYIYSLENDDLTNEKKIRATFSLICKIKKNSELSCYGKRID